MLICYSIGYQAALISSSITGSLWLSFTLAMLVVLANQQDILNALRDQDVALELSATAVYTSYAEAVVRAGVRMNDSVDL